MSICPETPESSCYVNMIPEKKGVHAKSHMLDHWACVFIVYVVCHIMSGAKLILHTEQTFKSPDVDISYMPSGSLT